MTPATAVTGTILLSTLEGIRPSDILATPATWKKPLNQGEVIAETDHGVRNALRRGAIDLPHAQRLSQESIRHNQLLNAIGISVEEGSTQLLEVSGELAQRRMQEQHAHLSPAEKERMNQLRETLAEIATQTEEPVLTSK